jgi:alpha-tubulin suppressor-like RCC1 family protein
VLLPELTGVTQMAAGFLHSAAVRSDGGLFVWGANGNGQLGDTTTFSRQRPVRLDGVTDIAAAAAGAFHTVALKRDGTVLTWGDNSQGQLGNGVYTFRSAPTQVPGAAGIAEISAGYMHSLARTLDGRVLGWGSNISNQFGDDSVGHSSPVAIAGLANVTAISAGVFHSLALLVDGTVRGFGSNYRGRLGTGNEDGTSAAVAVLGLAGVRQVSAGGGHSLAVKVDGTVWAWGENGEGQVGDGTTTDRLAPVQVMGLSGVVEVVAGPAHSLARKADGSVWAWGRNVEGQLGDRSATDRATPVRVLDLPPVSALAAGRDFSLALANGAVWAWGINYNGGIGCPACDGRVAPVLLPGLSRIAAISSKQYHVLAVKDDGSVYAWGNGRLGQLGDGTLVDRDSPIVVLREGASGSVAGNDWFLDLDPAIASTVAPEYVPVFLVAAAAAGTDITADIRYRPQDVGSSGSVFVFAMAPASQVAGGTSSAALKVGVAKGGTKADAPVACVLAQLNAAGQMVAVTSANLAAYVSGVLSAQGASVSILNGVPPGNVPGATFFVGYGANGAAMINGGVNRAAVTVPGTLTCEPARPQTGWWWNPLEDGRGYSVEVRGNNIFFASFLYDVSGRSTWYVSTGPASLEGSYYSGALLNATGGQTLGGSYPGRPAISTLGNMTLTFHNEASGTLVWPGGTVPIQRFNIITNGLNLPAVAGQPESGWWWNEQEDGRGFFMEWQNGWLDIAGYMYDDAGNPVWYLTVGQIGGTSSARSFSGNWWSYGNGMTLHGPWRPNQQLSTNVAPLTITFSGTDTALMTLPSGRTSNLRRHRF